MCSLIKCFSGCDFVVRFNNYGCDLMTLLDLLVLLLIKENDLEITYHDEHRIYLGADAWVSCDEVLKDEE